MIKKSNKGISLPIAILIIVVILGGGLLAFYLLNQKTETPEDDLIKVDSPKVNQTVQSPFIIKGEARGNWYFEATFPVKLLDENGNIIKQTYAQAQGEWMTENFVPFESVLTFSVPRDQAGTLVLEKDNPSGLPENDDEIRVSVMLKAGELQAGFSETGNLTRDNPGLKGGVWYLVYEKPGSPALYAELKINDDSLCQIGSIYQSCRQTALESGDRVEIVGWEIDNAVIVKNMLIQKSPAQLRAVKLYYYNPNLDKDGMGNILCSRQGLVAVNREIPITNTPIQDTVRLLISGSLTEQEKVQGITTEYPLEGLSLTGASLSNGVLTLTFEDPSNKTGGGSCRVGILWFQIEATAKQFSGIQQVRFQPEYLFQP